MKATKFCRDCVFFRYPEPSSFIDRVLVTYYCPHACMQWSGALGFTTGGSEACKYFEEKTQLTLF